MKFEDFRNITEHSLFELEDDEWIVFMKILMMMMFLKF